MVQRLAEIACRALSSNAHYIMADKARIDVHSRRAKTLCTPELGSTPQDLVIEGI